MFNQYQIEPALHLKRDTDEILLANDADLDAQDAEFECVHDYSHTVLAPYGFTD